MIDHQAEARAVVLQELQSQSLAPERLQEIAVSHPDLFREIAAHPNAYADLVEWARLQEAQATAELQAHNEPHDESPTEQPTASHTAQEALVADQTPRATGSQRLGAVLLGVGIGLVLGAVITAVLLIWVLPGLVGSFIG